MRSVVAVVEVLKSGSRVVKERRVEWRRMTGREKRRDGGE